MKNTIIVKPAAGLTNRLRVIESGLSLAKTLNKPLQVVWVTDSEMVANFDDLFMATNLFHVHSHDKYRFARSSFSLRGLKKSASTLINQYYGIHLAFSDIDISALVSSKKNDLNESCINKNVYFFTCQRFYPFSFNYSWLQPIPEIQQKIDRFTRQLGSNQCVGIHIRRTDHLKSINHSPDYLFEKAIDQELEDDPGALFFLATDDQPTEKRIIDKYGANRILVNPKKFGRDTVEATRDAVADLLSLSNCRKLYRSYWSSFSDTASVISGAETIVCKIDDKDTTV